MSLVTINEYNIFNHRPISPADIHYLYKPYGEICPINPEETIIKAVRNNQKIIIRAWAGTGKTCIINYIVSKFDTSYFPIMFPVWIGSDLDKICSDASEFILFMLHRVLYEVREARKISERDFNKYRKYLSGELSFKEGRSDSVLSKLRTKISWIPGFANIGAEVGGEIEKYIEYSIKEKIYLQDRIGCINGIIKILNSKNITPVFVLDDTDKFLQRGIINKTDLIDKFFVYIVPLFEKFECPLIFPVHESYLMYDTYNNIEKNIIEKIVTIPSLSLKAYSTMLEHKINSILEESKLSDFFEPEAIELVYSQLYEKKTNDRMRDSLRAIKEAVKDAIDNCIEKVDINLMAHHLLD